MALATSGTLTLADIQTEFGGSNPVGLNEYYAGGTYVPASTTGTYGAVPSSGQISIRNFYGTSKVIPVTVQNVFATSLYTPTGSATTTVTNNVDMTTDGGVIMARGRSGSISYGGTYVRTFIPYTGKFDTAWDGAEADFHGLISLNSTGFTISEGNPNGINKTGIPHVAWAFKRKPKFLDIVTWTGDGTNSRQITHALASVPGSVWVKRRNSTGNWMVYHKDRTGGDKNIILNSTAPEATFGNAAINDVTSTYFRVDSANDLNASGGTYMALVWAHDAGGFGASGTDSIIYCGSFTRSSTANVTVTTGFEPQFILVKNNSNTDDWRLVDTTRGMPASPTGTPLIRPNTYDPESNAANQAYTTSTGFVWTGGSTLGTTGTHIFLAIRKNM